MDTIGAVSAHLQAILGERADALGRSSGFIRRARKLTGSGFARLLVGGWLSLPRGSLSSLCRLAAAVQGPRLSAQGLAQRLDERAAAFLLALLGEAAQRVLKASTPLSSALLERFSAVWLVDTTVLALPPELASAWPGTGSRNGVSNTAALKAELALELRQGQLAGPQLLAGRAHDTRGPLAQAPLPAGSLRVADLAYFSLAQFAQRHVQGGYFLSRLRAGTTCLGAEGAPVALLETLQAWGQQGRTRGELEVRLGEQGRCAARLLILQAPPEVVAERRRRRRAAAQSQGRTPSTRSLALQEWTLLITNAPSALLSVEEALSLYAARWQIELVFKLWKSHGGLAQVRSQKPQRVLIAHYAHLLALLLQHWLLLCAWSAPALSRLKAAELIRTLAPRLLGVLHRPRQLRTLLGQIAHGLEHECRLQRRRKRPSSAQLLNGQGLPWGLS